ncbi:hypothetical protein [Nostoc sp. TCL26-01]|uniref:hypothetical protein n=1 Tax=Nostoc sp. TCL26-01 TaxID=2576904 RepID=UPI0015BB7385|nr:hypothetical protein [Nostoc sp. TCL26-01]
MFKLIASSFIIIALIFALLIPSIVFKETVDYNSFGKIKIGMTPYNLSCLGFPEFKHLLHLMNKPVVQKLRTKFCLLTNSTPLACCIYVCTAYALRAFLLN